MQSVHRTEIGLRVAVPLALQCGRPLAEPITLHQLQHTAVRSNQFIDEKQNLIVRLPVPSFVPQVFAVGNEIVDR